jgi:hypothetical protein
MKLPDIGPEIAFLALVACATITASCGHEGFAIAFLIMAVLVGF